VSHNGDDAETAINIDTYDDFGITVTVQ